MSGRLLAPIETENDMTPTPQNPKAARDEGFEREAVHVMTFTAADSGAALSAVQGELALSGGDLNGLTLQRRDRLVEGVLRVSNLTCARARASSDRLAAAPGVLSARVEHHLYRTGRAA
jgi:hypothetical protein